MTDTPSGPKIVAMYDEELASKLLKISGAEGVMSAPELSSQLKSWAEFSLRLLQDALNTDTSPTTTTLRKELKDIADTAGGLHEKLISLSIDASMHIEHQFVDDPIEGNEVMASIISSLDALTKASAHAADALLNVKRGEKQRCNFTRADCVGELGILWRMLTGKRPTRRVHSDDSSDYKKPYGPFHDFVVTALKPIFGDKKENRGIDAVIKGVVSGMEKNPRDYWYLFFHR